MAEGNNKKLSAGWLTDKVGEEGGVVKEALEARVRVADDQRMHHVPRPVLQFDRLRVGLLHGSFNIVHAPHTVLMDGQAPECAVRPTMRMHKAY